MDDLRGRTRINRILRNRSRRKVLIVVLVAALIVLAYPVSTRADEPITVAIIYVAGTIIAAGITAYAVIESSKSAGGTVDPPALAAEEPPQEEKPDVVKEIVDNNTDELTFTLPGDFLPELEPFLPISNMVETTTLSTLDDELSVDVNATNQIAVYDLSECAGAPIVPCVPTILYSLANYDLARVASAKFMRPEGAVGDGTLALALDISSLTMSTVPDPRTTAVAGWEIEVISPELGTLFTAMAQVEEEGDLTATGDIVLSDYVSTPGSGAASLSKVVNLNVPVPAALQTVDLEIRVRTFGEAIATTKMPASGWMAAIALVALLGACVFLIVRREPAT